MKMTFHRSWTHSAKRLAPLAVALLATQAFSAPPAPTTMPGGQLVLAYVTVKKGMDPSKKGGYESALKAACGDLGAAANAQKINAQVVGGWSEDQYKNQNDPRSNPTKKYGLHLTVETFDGANRTGRWHLYESGSVWVDRKGDGKTSVEDCHS